MSSSLQSMADRRRAVALRTATAVGLGFLFASALVLAASALLIAGGLSSRGGAVHGTSALTWLIWAAVAMWAFHTPRPVRFAIGLVLVSAVLLMAGFAIGWGPPQ
jgi:hypothetical protein